MYWFYCLLSVSMMVFCWTVYQGPPRPLAEVVTELLTKYAPGLAASLILLPIVMVDVVRFSNSFVGPVHRLKGHMHRLAQGEQVSALNFRTGDYWVELAASFNVLASKVQLTADDAVRTTANSQDESDETVCC
jgi:hypothetical protein